ncbi:polysaccharide lyase-domain-containing protein [Mycena olivaceomarginata]|nr:polysaccharide lyase-domain-containing protein [Mycena olivaceomarginata]
MHILIGVLAALSATASATQTFANRGSTPGGWDFILKENQGTVDQVSNVFYGSRGTAIKVTQTYTPGYTGRYHSEVHRFQGNWQFAPAQSYNLAQFIADFSDTGCDDWMPSSMVWIIGNQLATRVKTGSVCNQVTTEFKNLATVSAGAWHKVVIQANWQNDGTGFYKLWFDGVKETREFQFHVGLYANGWHDDGSMKGTQPFRAGVV